MKNISLEVTTAQEGDRIDKYLSSLLPELSRSYIQKLILEENVKLNGQCVGASKKVSCEDLVEIMVPDAVEPEIKAENIPLDILYEDNDLIIVNKPKGMVVHPAPGHYSNTMVNALLYHCTNLSGINGVLRPGIVHRIDMNTTGSVIVCKNDICHRAMAQMLKEHSIDRRYRTIVYGNFTETDGTISGKIGRSQNDRKKMMNNAPNGKDAVTHYKVLESYKGYSYLECRLETGRTHQIRVHMSSIGHPVLGDDTYSNRKSQYHLEGQTLHAYFLGFKHPITGEYIEVTAPIPDYFEKLLIDMRKNLI